MEKNRRRAGYGAISSFLLAGVPPAIGKGLETMHWEWAEWTGPYQVVFGVLMALAGLGLGAYALELDRRFRRASVSGYLTPSQVINYLAHESQWGDTTDQFVAETRGRDGTVVQVRKNTLLEAFEEFQLRAQERGSAISAVGMEWGVGVPVPIEHTFWLTNGLSMTDVLANGDRTAPTAPGNIPWGASTRERPFYSAVRIERFGVEKTWPRMGAKARRAAQKRHDERDAELQRWFESGSVPPEEDLVTAEEAGQWLYTNGSEKVRDVLRRNVPSLWATITEAGVAYVRDGAEEAGYQLYARREEGLPWEKISAVDCDFSTFEELFGTDRKPPMPLAMRRRDLRAMLQHYES